MTNPVAWDVVGTTPAWEFNHKERMWTRAFHNGSGTIVLHDNDNIREYKWHVNVDGNEYVSVSPSFKEARERAESFADSLEQLEQIKEYL